MKHNFLKINGKTTLCWLRFYAICTVGIVAFMVLCGEENPNHPLSLMQYFGIKLIALMVFVANVLVGRYFRRKGLFPLDLDKEE